MLKVKQIKTNQKLVPIKVVNQYPKFECNSEDQTSDINLAISQLYISEDEGNNITINYSNSRKTINFHTSQLPHCCGIIELGDIQCSKDIDSKTLITILNGIVNIVKGKTLIINTNGQESSINFETVLPKCKNWVLVKTFKNSGRNTIKMWVSNNE